MSVADWIGSCIDSRCAALFDTYASSAVKRGSITFVFPGKPTKVFGQLPTAKRGEGVGGQLTDDDEMHALVVVNSDHAFTRIVFSSDIGLGEAYMHREIECEHPTRLLKLLCLNSATLSKGNQTATRLGWATWFGMRLAHLEHALHDNTVEGSKRNISAHYDVGNTLYKAFLDETLTYSCGFYSGRGDSLHQSQLNKLDKMIAAAGIKDGDNVLEIGSGWGSMAIRTAQRFPRVTFTSLTVSEEQRVEAVRRVEALGLDDRVQILFRDYRKYVNAETEATYDAVVSIEMIEAVGHENLPEYFSVLGRALKPGGKVAVQAITIPDDKYDRYRKGSDFIRKYIFPGGHLPSYGIMDEFSQLAGLSRVHEEDIGLHYAPTLKAWHDNFLAAPGIEAETGDLFHRTWRWYFAYCEAAFATKYLRVYQIAWERPKAAVQLVAPARGSKGVMRRVADIVQSMYWGANGASARKVLVHD